MGNLSKIRRKILKNPTAYYQRDSFGRIRVFPVGKKGSPLTFYGAKSYKNFVKKTLEDIIKDPVRQ